MQHKPKSAFDAAAQTHIEASAGHHPLALAIAEAMGRLIGCQARCVTKDELIGEGFSEAELIAHGPEATVLARQNFVRTLDEPATQYTAPVSSYTAPDAVRGLPAREAHEALPEKVGPGFSVRQRDHQKEQRANRVAYGATIIGGLMPDIRPIHLALRGDGFSNREIGDLIEDILAVAGDEFAAILHGGSA